jgi:hypothetical protein
MSLLRNPRFACFGNTLVHELHCGHFIQTSHVERCAANCKSIDEPDEREEILPCNFCLCKICIEDDVNKEIDELVQSVAETESHHDRFEGLPWPKILDLIEHELRIESDGRDNYRRDWWLEDRIEKEKKSGIRMCSSLGSTAQAAWNINTSDERNHSDDILAPNWGLLDDEDDSSTIITHPDHRSDIDQAVSSVQRQLPVNLNHARHPVFNYRRIRSSTPAPEFDPFDTPYDGWVRPSTKIHDDDVALAGTAEQFGVNMPKAENLSEKVPKGEGSHEKETKMKEKRFKKTGTAGFSGERGLLAAICASYNGTASPSISHESLD